MTAMDLDVGSDDLVDATNSLFRDAVASQGTGSPALLSHLPDVDNDIVGEEDAPSSQPQMPNSERILEVLRTVRFSSNLALKYLLSILIDKPSKIKIHVPESYRLPRRLKNVPGYGADLEKLGFLNREAKYSEYHRWSADPSRFNATDFQKALSIYGPEQLRADLRIQETSSMLQQSTVSPPPSQQHTPQTNLSHSPEEDEPDNPPSLSASHFVADNAQANPAPVAVSGSSSTSFYSRPASSSSFAPHVHVLPPMHAPVSAHVLQEICPPLAMYQQLLYMQLNETSAANKHYIDKLKEELLRRFESQYLNG